MEDTFNFYIDKNRNNKYNTELSVIPHHPIINDQDDSIVKIKLLDFKFLNTFYNISSTLVNNQFNIKKTSKTYTYTWTGTALYFDDTWFFDGQNALIATETIDGDANTDTITNGELSLVYNHELINETSYWLNILSDTPDVSRKMSMLKNNRWFEIITDDNNRISSLDCIFYKDTYTSGTTTDITIKFQRYNSSNSSWEDIDSNVITFQNLVPEEQVATTLTYTNAQPNNKYRLIYDTANQLGLPFPLYIIKLQANKQIPVFDNGTIDAPVENTITIPDGFYKASNFRKKLNELLISYKITVSIDEYTNKIKFTNDNTTFTPSINDLIDENFKLDLVIPNNNMKDNLGITLNSYETYIPIPFNSYYESDTHINLMNFTKIIITTNLSFKHKTHNDILNNVNPYCKSFGNILTWIDSDEAPFTCIKYTNYENVEYEIVNDHINYISFKFYNENSQELFLDNCLLHFQIKKVYRNRINDYQH